MFQKTNELDRLSSCIFNVSDIMVVTRINLGWLNIVNVFLFGLIESVCACVL